MNQLSTTTDSARTSILCLTLLLLAWTFPGGVQGQAAQKQSQVVGGGERYALLVGVRKYDKASGLRPLAYTENDVTKMAELLYQSGYRPENTPPVPIPAYSPRWVPHPQSSHEDSLD